MTRVALKAFFETGDKPTEEQFAQLIDEMAHKTEDVAILGLKEFESEISYVTGQGVLKDGLLYQFLQNHLGAWNAAHVIQVPNLNLSIPGVVAYDNAEEYEEDDLVSYLGKIYRSKANGNQGNTPPNGTWWEVINYSNGTLREWEALTFFIEGETVKYFGQLFEANEDMVSEDIQAEIEDGKWNLVGGLKNMHTIPAGDRVDVPRGYIAVVYGDLTVEEGATLRVYTGGKVQIINGVLVENGAVIQDGVVSTVELD